MLQASMAIATMLSLGLSTTAATTTIDEMLNEYSNIFQSGNRNAASHRWATWILDRAPTLTEHDLTTLFTGFCPVSGSPVTPTPYNTYHYRLPLVSGGGHANGFLHHCCSPCVCDTLDAIAADTKVITLAGGATRELTFAVIGDPCLHPEALARSYTDAFSGSQTTLAQQAPEVVCDAHGQLRGATRSDYGKIIIGLLGPAPSSLTSLPAPTEPNPGRVATIGGVTFHDSREFATYCSERAASGYNSGMGLIFRLVAQINPAVQPIAAPASPSPSCGHLLDAKRISEIDSLISTEPVLLFGMAHTRCAAAAAERLERAGACFKHESWSDADDPLWSYMKCKHPHEIVNGMEMHSYVYIGGRFVGNGFKLREEAMASTELNRLLSAAGAKMECSKSCDSLASASDRATLEQMKAQPLALLGWSGCPCTNIARSRFEAEGACYVQTVWPTDTAPLYKYLQCVHGEHHHSFVFANGKFLGDGFQLEQQRMAPARFSALLAEASARLTCQREGDLNLGNRPLQPCTQSNDGSTTGWTRTGSCNWDPSDSGYHEVCVTMSEQFLASSARHDANDLSSVVNAGGHWCICAWAWASAVTRDPHSNTPEGITLECERTNYKLREVYESHMRMGADLHSPSGAAYKAKEALDAVNRVCNRSSMEGAPSLSAPSAVKATAAAIATVASHRHGTSAIGQAVAVCIVPIIIVATLVLLLVRKRGRGTRKPDEKKPLSYASDVEEDKLGCYDSDEPRSVEPTPSTASLIIKA